MDDLFKIVILALVQGITEFLPISSSGHLSILKTFLDINSDGALIEVVLHAGTALSTIVIFRKDILDILKGLLQFKSNEELSNLIISVSRAENKDGGEGAIIIKLK